MMGSNMSQMDNLVEPLPSLPSCSGLLRCVQPQNQNLIRPIKDKQSEKAIDHQEKGAAIFKVAQFAI